MPAPGHVLIGCDYSALELCTLAEIIYDRLRARLEDWINALPRKIFDGLSAEEKAKRHFEENAA